MITFNDALNLRTYEKFESKVKELLRECVYNFETVRVLSWAVLTYELPSAHAKEGYEERPLYLEWDRSLREDHFVTDPHFPNQGYIHRPDFIEEWGSVERCLIFLNDYELQNHYLRWLQNEVSKRVLIGKRTGKLDVLSKLINLELGSLSLKLPKASDSPQLLKHVRWKGSITQLDYFLQRLLRTNLILADPKQEKLIWRSSQAFLAALLYKLEEHGLIDRYKSAEAFAQEFLIGNKAIKSSSLQRQKEKEKGEWKDAELIVGEIMARL